MQQICRKELRFKMSHQKKIPLLAKKDKQIHVCLLIKWLFCSNSNVSEWGYIFSMCPVAILSDGAQESCRVAGERPKDSSENDED